MYFETERLIIRELTFSDYQALYEILADSDIMRHYPYTFDEVRVKKWIEKNIERYKVFGFGLFAVVLKENGKMIGDCGITMQNVNGFIMPEIGYHINKNYWRKGYAKEAASKCRDWLFINTPFNVVCSYMKSDNIASRATAMSNGMVFVKEYTDDENEKTAVYEITRRQWESLSLDTAE